ncbi:MAG TPA: efflux RND transporter periplasmic adaptor subunit [Longimicrobiales bacterium]|nr:efflux RND transporter periplasmic adaptor subunit [Longimicrobiales bacterium]
MMYAHGCGARRRLPMLAILTSVVAVSACAGSDDAVAEPEHESVVITQWNDSTELFLEYPHVRAGEATGNWAIHLSSMKDFKPIRSGRLTVRFLSAEGVAETFTIDSVARDGIFLLDPVVARPGTYQVELALESPQVSSRHMLPEVRVFAREDEIPLATEEDGGGGIAFLKEQQWQIAWEVVPAREDTVQNTIAAPGEIVAPDGALVEISAPMDGIAAATANRGAPSVGQSVRRGQVLVVLSPTAQDGGFAQARSRLERLEREVERDERLYAAGAIPQRRLEEARHDLEVARAEVTAMGAGGVGGDYRLRLTSPINGVVARRSFVPGGRVEAGTPLFTIVDPRTAWLRVQVPASAATGIPSNARATFTTEGSQQVHTTSRLVSVGSVLDPRTRTVPVVFEIAEAGALYTFGQLAQVAVPSGGEVTGVVIPNRAIIDDNGTPVAYVQTGGEEFERRVLSLGASDGVRTHIVAGVRAGEMVVTTGAFQVRLASMSGDDFAGGHAH